MGEIVEEVGRLVKFALFAIRFCEITTFPDISVFPYTFKFLRNKTLFDTSNVPLISTFPDTSVLPFIIVFPDISTFFATRKFSVISKFPYNIRSPLISLKNVTYELG